MKDTAAALGLLFLRVFSGCFIATHGYQKLFGGGMEMFLPGVIGMGFPMPLIFAHLAALSEFGGGVLLALGLFTRIGALMIFITMSVAAFVAHGKDGFEIREKALLYWTVAGAISLTGAGYYSLDAVLARRRSKVVT